MHILWVRCLLGRIGDDVHELCRWLFRRFDWIGYMHSLYSWVVLCNNWPHCGDGRLRCWQVFRI